MYEFSYVTLFYGYMIVIIMSVIYVFKHPQMNIVPKIIMSLMIGILVYILLSSQWATYVRTSYIHRSTEPVLPVGSGWSFYLDKGRRTGNVYYTRHMRGELSDGYFGSGTMIKEVQKVLKKENKTLFSYPSIENGTLGGWIASGSHGSGGTLWKTSFGKITVWNMNTDSIFETDVNSIFGKDKYIEDCKKYVILQVQVIPHDDVFCSKYAYKVNTVEDCHHFLNEPSYLRMIQIGKRGKMALMWTPYKHNPLEHNDPHFVSRIGLYVQSDILSMYQSSNSRNKDWFDFPVECKKNFISKILLSKANKFTIEPPLLLTPIGFLYKNFEFFIFETVSAKQLHDFTEKLCDLFACKLHGRCELRCGKNLLFLDFVIGIKDCHIPILECIKQTFGNAKIRLHRGKYQI